MDTPKHSDFRGDRCGAQARRRVSVFKGSFLCLEKNCWPGPTGLLSLPHTVISSHSWGRRDDLQTEQHVAGEFLCQQFSRREQIPPATRVCFGSSISPPEKARIFSYNMCSNISLLSTWVAWAGNRHKTPRDSSSTAKRHLFYHKTSTLRNLKIANQRSTFRSFHR